MGFSVKRMGIMVDSFICLCTFFFLQKHPYEDLYLSLLVLDLSLPCSYLLPAVQLESIIQFCE